MRTKKHCHLKNQHFILLFIAAAIIMVCIFLTSKQQNFEQKVCDCIGHNFQKVHFDYFQTLQHIEQDLTESNIIDNSPSSIMKQIENVSYYGFIESPRTYENVLFEQLAFKTLNYCINLHTYGGNNTSPSVYFQMMREIEILNQNFTSPPDLINLRKEHAKILLKYRDNISYSNLWRIIQIQYLYFFSETQEMKNIIRLPPFQSAVTDSTNIIQVHVSSRNEVLVDNRKIELNQLCNTISVGIENREEILLTNEAGTQYAQYLNIYKSLKICIEKYRDDKSQELFGKNYDLLSNVEKDEIMFLFPMNIVESSPQDRSSSDIKMEMK